MFGGNFAPNGWFLCHGQQLPISEYEVLFNLIGTTYGGDGQTTFALPDLRSRIPVHQGTSQGSSYILGQMAGQESVTLTANQIAAHNHLATCSAAKGNSTSPGGNVPATSATALYGAVPNAAMNNSEVGPAGGGQPHDNMPPFLVVNFIIAWAGIYPSQN